MRKQLRIALVILLIATAMFGCKKNEKSTNQIGSEVESETEDVNVDLDGYLGEYSAFTVEEMKTAFERKIIDAELLDHLDSDVTKDEWGEMVKAAADYLGIDVTDKVKDSDLGSSTLKRMDAAKQTVEILNTDLFSKANKNKFGSITLSPDDSEKLGNVYDDDNLWWATATIDFTTNQSMLDMDEHYSFRPDDTMTVLECAQMLLRVSNFSFADSDYVKFTDVPDYELTNTLLEQAKKMPDVSADNFDFHGVIIDNKENDGSNSTIKVSPWYSENQVKLIHDMGFNFTRASLFYGLFFSNDGKIDLTHLENMDNLVTWCIENDVHLCFSLFDYPMDNTYDVDSFIEFWKMMAEHYKDVPNNALSFNLINEPYALYDGDDREQKIEELTKQLLSAVKSVDSERLIFMCSLEGDDSTIWGGPDRKPSYTLSEEKGIQTVHCYYGPFNGDALSQSGGYPSENMWPFPYAHSTFDENSPITISGDFTSGEEVTIRARFTYEDENTIYASLDGKQIGTLKVSDGVSYDNGVSKCYSFVLPSDGKEIKLSIDGFMQIFTVEIVHNEDSDEPIPYQKPYCGDIYPTERNSNKLVTNVQCEWNGKNTSAPQHIIVSADGTYTTDKIEGWPLSQTDYGYAGIKEYFDIWEKFINETGQKYMVMEMGFYFSVNTPIELRTQYLDEFLTVLDENNVSWNTLDREWLTQFIYSVDTEKAEWIQMDGFWVNKTLLDVYQKHLSTN